MVSVLFRELNEKQSHSGSIPMFDFQIFTVVFQQQFWPNASDAQIDEARHKYALVSLKLAVETHPWQSLSLLFSSAFPI